MAIKRITPADKAEFVAVRKGRSVKLDSDAVAVIESMLAQGEEFVDPDSVKGKSRGRLLAALKAKAPTLKLKQRSGEIDGTPCVRIWAVKADA